VSYYQSKQKEIRNRAPGIIMTKCLARMHSPVYHKSERAENSPPETSISNALPKCPVHLSARRPQPDLKTSSTLRFLK
jgi:hypothetical protein